MQQVSVMKRFVSKTSCLFIAALLAVSSPSLSEAKSYSSGGGRSYSSSSSRSSGSSHSSSSGRSSGSGSSTRSSGSSSGSSHSSGSSSSSSRNSGSQNSGSKSFNSGSGKSYSSGSTWSDGGKKSYTSGKSYSSGSDRDLVRGSRNPDNGPVGNAGARNERPADSGFSFDTAAARARKEQASKTEFNRFKDSQRPQTGTTPSAPADNSYRGQPPPIINSGNGSYRGGTVYVPDSYTIRTRPIRVYNIFNPYWSRPVVVYRDPFSSLFWWWLLDRSIEDQAWWAYHHRYDMDPSRYQALLASNQQLEARVAYLEGQQTPRDPAFVPTGLDRDLMYTDHYVTHNYSNRPTRAGAIAFWIFAVPLAMAFCCFFIWLIWFKRWQVSA